MVDTRKNVLRQQFQDPALSLSPEELNALNYHRNNLAPGKYMPQKNGEITTFYGARMETPEGVMYFPTYWGGKILPPKEAIKKALSSGIKFPIYKNDEEAAKRESVIHDIMSSDVDEFKKKMNKE